MFYQYSQNKQIIYSNINLYSLHGFSDFGRYLLTQPLIGSPWIDHTYLIVHSSTVVNVIVHKYLVDHLLRLVFIVRVNPQNFGQFRLKFARVDNNQND